jgi:hypothetical protein
MTVGRSLTLAAGLLAALAAAAIIAMASAPPADAHGFCTPWAYEPTKNTSTGKIRGFGDHSCTETHTYINIEVCLQKEVAGQWSTVICTLQSASSTTFISAPITTNCTSSSHGGKYRTRTYGFTSAAIPGSQDGHMNRHWSTARTFSCP